MVRILPREHVSFLDDDGGERTAMIANKFQGEDE